MASEGLKTRAVFLLSGKSELLEQYTGVPPVQNGEKQDETFDKPLSMFLADRANQITITGCLLTSLCIPAIMNERYYLSMSLMTLGIVMDYLDGYVAKNTPGRNPIQQKFGAACDSLADFFNGGVIPAIFVMRIGNMEAFPVFAGVIYVTAVCVRLSYFDLVGMVYGGAYYLGLPKDYGQVIIIVLCYLMPFLSRDTFVSLLCVVMLILAYGFLTSKLRVRYLTGYQFIAVLAFFMSLAVTGVLVECSEAWAATASRLIFNALALVMYTFVSYATYFRYVELNI